MYVLTDKEEGEGVCGPPPDTAVNGVVAAGHGHDEEDLRWMASPVNQSKVVSVGAVETDRRPEVRAVSLASTPTVKDSKVSICSRK